MKLRIISLAFAACMLFSCGTTSNTTTTTSTQEGAFQTNAALQTTFSTQYPSATNVTWSAYDAATLPNDWDLVGWTPLTASDYTVAFDMNGNKYYAWYDANGNWIGSTYAISNYSTLPANVNNLLMNRYNGYSIESVNREMWHNQNAYEIKLKNGDNKIKLLVDDSGNVLKEKNK